MSLQYVKEVWEAIPEELRGILAERAVLVASTPLQKLGFRKKVLKELPKQLNLLGIQGDRCQYVVKQFSQPEALKSVGRLSTLDEFYLETVRWLQYPQQLAAGDPRQTEGELVTAALILSVLKVSNPGQYQSLVGEMQQRSMLVQQFPTIGQAVREVEERRKAPLKMAANDISQVLVRAGQHEAKIVTGADGEWEINGPLNLQFSAQGENAKRLQEWLQEAEGRLVLDLSDGSIQVSLGDQELDKLFFPGEASHFAFERAEVELDARLKIIGKTRAKFVGGTFLIKPADGEIHLTIGHEKCRLHFIFRPKPGQPTTVNLHIGAGDRPLPLADAGLLDTLALILEEESCIQVLSWVNQYTQEKQEVETEAIIFTMDQQLEDVERFRWGIHVHLLLLKVVELISEAGFDPDELIMPELPFDKAVDALQQILDTHNAAGIGNKVQITAVPTRSGYKQLQQAVVPLLRIGNEIGFGPVAVVSHRNVTDFQIVRAVEKPESDGVDVIIEGKWGEGEVRFLTPEQYQLEFGAEGGQP